jgi:hypothetical protein
MGVLVTECNERHASVRGVVVRVICWVQQGGASGGGAARGVGRGEARAVAATIGWRLSGEEAGEMGKEVEEEEKRGELEGEGGQADCAPGGEIYRRPRPGGRREDLFPCGFDLFRQGLTAVDLAGLSWPRRARARLRRHGFVVLSNHGRRLLFQRGRRLPCSR